MKDEKTLQDALKSIADESWDEFQSPILLSNVAPKLPPYFDGEDYKEVLAGRSLKAFVKSSDGALGYKLVEHPVLKSKVGLIPSEQNFQFPAVDGAESAPRATSDARKNEAVLLAFLRSLSRLSNEDLDKINIPLSVIAKLIK